jgi:formate dehydrogenase subunit gamma
VEKRLVVNHKKTMAKHLINIINPFLDKKGGLMPALHAIQDHLGFISKDNIGELAIAFNCSQAEVIDVITFYDDFRLKAIGKNIIKICQAEACQSQNCKELLRNLTSHFGLEINETSDDSNIILREVFCLGNCAIGPSVMINDMVIGEATIEKVVNQLKVITAEE